MARERLLGLHGVTFRTPDRVEVGPIHLEVHRRDKILLRCEPGTVYDAFLALLTGELQPLAGRLDELKPVRIQTDRHLLETINPNRTLRELLAEARLPDSIWIGQRRRSLFGVMDRLGLETRYFHRPLKMEPKAMADKFWALRFLASGAELLVGREIFALEDAAIREVLAQRWGDLSAAVIYAGPEERIPAPPNAVLTFEADGHVSVKVADSLREAEEAGDEPAGVPTPEPPDER